MFVITHRGINASAENYFKESSFDAFVDHLRSGYGIEFDPQFSADGEVFIYHEDKLDRISPELSGKSISHTDSSQVNLPYYGVSTLEEVLIAIQNYSRPNVTHAIHLKGNNQSQKNIDTLLKKLADLDYKSYFIFDVDLDIAQYIKKISPNTQLAPSVSHQYDRKRYNSYVFNTLLSPEEVLDNSHLFNWVWLDEWDRKDSRGNKKLYTEELVDRFKRLGIKVALVSPELHATSPNLMANENHEDAQTKTTLFNRLKKISTIGADAICTDFPVELNFMLPK